MIGVPAVWELIRKGIMAKVSKSGAVKKAIFNRALRIKQFASDYSVPGLAGLTDAVVFNAVKAQTGGRLKIAFSGGGSLSATTQEFVNNSVAQLIQGGSLALAKRAFRTSLTFFSLPLDIRLRLDRIRRHVRHPPPVVLQLRCRWMPCAFH